METGVQANRALKLRPCFLLLDEAVDLGWPEIFLRKKTFRHSYGICSNIGNIVCLGQTKYICGSSVCKFLAESWRN